MLGYVEMREVAIWIQTTDYAEVRLAYWPEKDKKQVSSIMHFTEGLANTALFVCSDLEPGTTYEYEVLVNGSVENKGYTFGTALLNNTFYINKSRNNHKRF